MSSLNDQMIAQHGAKEDWLHEQDAQRERDVMAAEKRFISGCTGGIGFDLADHVEAAMRDLLLSEKQWRLIAECVANDLRNVIRDQSNGQKREFLNYLANVWAEKEVGE